MVGVYSEILPATELSVMQVSSTSMSSWRRARALVTCEMDSGGYISLGNVNYACDSGRKVHVKFSRG